MWVNYTVYKASAVEFNEAYKLQRTQLKERHMALDPVSLTRSNLLKDPASVYFNTRVMWNQKGPGY